MARGCNFCSEDSEAVKKRISICMVIHNYGNVAMGTLAMILIIVAGFVDPTVLHGNESRYAIFYLIPFGILSLALSSVSRRVRGKATELSEKNESDYLRKFQVWWEIYTGVSGGFIWLIIAVTVLPLMTIDPTWWIVGGVLRIGICFWFLGLYIFKSN